MPNTDISPETMARCFQEVLPQLLAIPESEVKKPRVSIPAVSALMFAAVERVARHEAAMVAQFPDDAAVVQSLRTRAFAMMHAYLDADMAEPVKPEVLAWVAQAVPLRIRLLRAAELLVAEGEITEDAVAAIREGSGYLDTATDLLRLDKLLSAHLAAVEKHTPQAKTLLPEAKELGAHLMRAVGVRNLPKEGDAEPVQIRDRAYTYFIAGYDEARAQLGYLRRYEGGVDTILPNIFSTRRSSTTASDTTDENDDLGAKGGSTNGATPAPFPVPSPKPNDPDNPFVS